MDRVEGWYLTYLNRAADPQAAAAFLAGLQAGVLDEVAVAFILGAPEFLSNN